MRTILMVVLEVLALLTAVYLLAAHSGHIWSLPVEAPRDASWQ